MWHQLSLPDSHAMTSWNCASLVGDHLTAAGTYHFEKITHLNPIAKNKYTSVKFSCWEKNIKLRYSTPVLTSLGRCHVINLRDSPYEWMRKQTEEGVDSGFLFFELVEMDHENYIIFRLQIILDTHLEEQFDGIGSKFMWKINIPIRIPILSCFHWFKISQCI